MLYCRQLCSSSRTSQHFIEPEGLLPCSQEPSIGPYSEPDQSNPISLRSILIFSTHLRLGLPSGLFPSGFPPICIPLSPHSCYMPYPSHPPWFDHSNYTWRRVQVMKLLIMQLLQPPVISSLFGDFFRHRPERTCPVHTSHIPSTKSHSQIKIILSSGI
jgi:hypothetical protein